MVLDSSDSIRESCQRTALERGLDCVIANNVPDALARVCAQKPVAILVNLALPVIPGTALVAALRASSAFRAIPIGALISAEASKDQFESYAPTMFQDRKEDFDSSINEFFDAIELGAAEDNMGTLLELGWAPRVLLAEDSPTNQLIMARMLHVAGADVTVVANGEEALQAIQTGTYDLVMMDIKMPKMDGIQATAKIRELGVNVPIIAVTGHEEDCVLSAEDKSFKGPPQTPAPSSRHSTPQAPTPPPLARSNSTAISIAQHFGDPRAQPIAGDRTCIPPGGHTAGPHFHGSQQPSNSNSVCAGARWSWLGRHVRQLKVIRDPSDGVHVRDRRDPTTLGKGTSPPKQGTSFPSARGPTTKPACSIARRRWPQVGGPL